MKKLFYGFYRYLRLPFATGVARFIIFQDNQKKKSQLTLKTITFKDVIIIILAIIFMILFLSFVSNAVVGDGTHNLQNQGWRNLFLDTIRYFTGFLS